MVFPEEKIEEVKAATDIVDVVGDYVRLKRSGANYKGLCPFHQEKTPSFHVNPSLGIFKCFGCDEAGDAIAFVQRVEGLGFVETLRLLAERAGIELPAAGTADPAAGENESLLHAVRFAARYYYAQLTQTEAGRKTGLEYFKARGFSQETIKKFGLGYAPDRWDALLEEAQKAHIAVETLEKAGLVLPRKSGGGHYDRFRGRVLFPIVSHVGKPLGFGGRILASDTDEPKYINSPETRIYHKGRVLYGLHQAKQAIRREEEAFLVEGYTDVISLHQAGVENVVAASGTALTPDQVRLLGRYARRVVLLFDADSAGAAAALRSIDVILAQGLTAYVISLPDRADPDSFVRQFGAEAFRNYAEKHRQSFVAFHAARARTEGLLDTPEGRMEAAQAILKSIASIPRQQNYYVMWEGYLRQAAQLLGVPDMHLRQQFPDLVRRASGKSAPSPPRVEQRQESPVARVRPQMKPEEGVLLRLMLEHGLVMVEFVLGRMALEEFTEGAVRDTVQHILDEYQTGRIDHAAFTRGDFGESAQRIASEVLVDRHTTSDNWMRQHNIRVPSLNQDPYEAAASAMTLLKLDRINEAIAERQKAVYASEQAGEDPRPILESMQELHALRARVERRQFLTDPEAAA